ncbi:MAG: flagellar hook-basal body protein [Planctomycetota bacterium]
MSDIVPRVSSTLGGLKQEFHTIAQNMANAETVGYKRKYNTFSQILAERGMRDKGEVGRGVDVDSSVDFTQGALFETGRSLDFGLIGKGFFVIETPDGPVYTRNGMFRLDGNGQIVDTAGRVVAGEGGPITVPRNVGLSQINVSADGNITADGLSIGRFKLVDFGDREGELVPVGINSFRAPKDARPVAATGLSVRQGFEESSNVQIVEELVDMMMVSRLYEANMQFVNVRRDAAKSIIDVAMS